MGLETLETPHRLNQFSDQLGVVKPISWPAHVREWRGKQGERLLQTRKQAIAESNQTATFLDAREGQVGQQHAPFF